MFNLVKNILCACEGETLSSIQWNCPFILGRRLVYGEKTAGQDILFKLLYSGVPGAAALN